ncbi:unnamed protein product, partial [Mesorhabditis belari]|uniref:Peptidase S1 domain-containing protein n=1 Tax=Mesorhabditis belari TaxID=2138241 RepID=A0AAF3F2H6_9BILA
MPTTAPISLILLLITQISTAFRPHFIGPPFRNHLSIDDNFHLASICGYQNQYSLEKEFPWAISLFKFKPNFPLELSRNQLGGSIISPFHILTVAHGFLVFKGQELTPCIIDRYRTIDELQQRFVAYGGKCIRGWDKADWLPNDQRCMRPDVTYNKIRSVMIDEDFAQNHCMKGHDWAIIELEKPIVWNNHTKPICLPNRNLYLDQILSVSGWGRASAFVDGNPYIRETPMYLNRECSRPWSDTLPNDAEDYLCANSVDMRNYTAPRTCHGDSGSGMEQRDQNGRAELVALTSFGTKGCPSNMLARFTKIANYLPHICTITGVCYRNF